VNEELCSMKQKVELIGWEFGAIVGLDRLVYGAALCLVQSSHLEIDGILSCRKSSFPPLVQRYNPEDRECSVDIGIRTDSLHQFSSDLFILILF
jgi:hypothetical protein